MIDNKKPTTHTQPMTKNLSSSVLDATYSDLMVFATRVADQMPSGSKWPPAAIADALVAAAQEDKTAVREVTDEERVIAKLFTRRRAMTVSNFRSPTGAGIGGYHMEVSTLKGSAVVGTDLRVMFGQMLDQVVTLHVLTGGQDGR